MTIPETQAFRPLARPPLALLSVIDDGDTQGEVVRVRTSPFVIGRAEGDLLVPHDSGMSTRHAELSRELENGRYRWSLRDLQSTNGTFVRVSGSVLKDLQELLLGGVRLRFVIASTPGPSGPPAGGPVATTQKWQALTSAGRPSAPAPELVVLTPQGEGRRYPLIGDEIWIGRDPERCTVVLNDPMVSPRHARIRKDPHGRWSIHNERSLNGLWIAIEEISLERGGQFQCGEQRFQVRIPESAST
ncbi:hypothetical protein BH23PLA1_BH23PLA1_25960 [soil metagenome]